MPLNQVSMGKVLSQLQPILNSIDRHLAKLQLKWPEKIILKNSQEELSALDFFPFLFWDAFPSICQEDIESLSMAGLLLVRSTLLYDKIMDRTTTAYLGTVSTLKLQVMQIETYSLLHQLFARSTSFWHHFNNYYAEYVEACLEEQCFASGEYPWQQYTEQKVLNIIKGKNGLARIAIAGLVELSGDNTLFEPLVESIHSFNIASQMWDDLCDWKEDLSHQLPSLLLSRLVDEWPVSRERLETNLDKSIARNLYYEGHARYAIEIALKELDRAEKFTANIQVPGWQYGIEHLRQKCQEFLKTLEQTVQHNLRRIQQQPHFTLELPPATTQWQQRAWDALNFIVHQWRLGFGEARHIMFLPPTEGFSTTQDYHANDIFQRALIADALCDVNLLLDGKLQPLLDYEAQYLIDSRLTSGVGGWSYFPTVPEVAPDADDLAQVMQVLLRSDRLQEVVEHCELPLSILLRDRTRPNGAIETWIIPAEGLTPQQQRQVEFNQTKWGTGPDNEVMANILYALHLYDRDRFIEPIQLGIKYLETQQERDGSWTSKWYYGQYYGTYVCLRLSIVAAPDSPAIASAIDFLKTTQHPDGGWGMSNRSDPLSTALALLGLAVVQTDTVRAEYIELVESALVYLERTQESHSGWQSVEFIRPKANEPYGSKTITTMYVLKATVAWHQLLASETKTAGKIELFPVPILA